eukprot:UC1_evm1s1670
MAAADDKIHDFAPRYHAALIQPDAQKFADRSKAAAAAAAAKRDTFRGNIATAANTSTPSSGDITDMLLPRAWDDQGRPDAELRWFVAEDIPECEFCPDDELDLQRYGLVCEGMDHGFDDPYNKDIHLEIRPPGERDFWRHTYYEPHMLKDDAGILGIACGSTDFTCEAKFGFYPKEKFDQAGLCLRIGADTWVKCGIEYVSSKRYLSTVVTRGHSDWSTQVLDDDEGKYDSKYVYRLRIHRVRSTSVAVEIWNDFPSDGRNPGWEFIRLAHIGEGDAVVGAYCASPIKSGMTMRLYDLK